MQTFLTFRTLVFFFLLISAAHSGQIVRQLGIQIGPYPSGPRNAITDVKGVRIGHVTLISEGASKLEVGKGPVRTGLTVVVPTEGDLWTSKVPAGAYVANGNGEAMGLAWLQESGALEGPIALTNTLSVGAAQRGLLDWTLRRHPSVSSLMPVVLECDDSTLNDIHGQHVKPDHISEAIEKARVDFAEGSVGAGTGMAAFDFKSGIGSSSRIVSIKNARGKAQKYTVGVLVNLNIGTGTRGIFRLGGVAMAKAIPDLMPIEKEFRAEKGAGSAVFVVATDALMDARQLNRLAKRVMYSLGRLGVVVYNGSGEFAVAFTTANRISTESDKAIVSLQTVTDSAMNNFFEAVVDAGEEAAINSLLESKTMDGRDGNKVFALPHDRVKKLLLEMPQTSVLKK
ncbi:MAG TPA: P1 family peptidase [Bdellovibrionota bacterium]|nr:P1 family peptidase [Bdellovibrionota bacterium]